MNEIAYKAPSIYDSIHIFSKLYMIDVAGHIIIQIIKPKRYLGLVKPEEVQVFFSFGEGDCWMSWVVFLFPLCSHWVPMGSSSSSQKVPHVTNVFPIVPCFYPICFTHIFDVQLEEIEPWTSYIHNWFTWEGWKSPIFPLKLFIWF